MNWRYSISIALSVILLALTTGCDRFKVFSRTARLNALPENTSVEAALKDVPEIKKVDYYQSKPVSPSDQRILRQFVYTSEHNGGVVKIQQTENGEKILSLYAIWMNRFPSPEVFAETAALMDSVYASLRKQLPYLPPPQELKVDLSGSENPTYMRAAVPK